MTDGVDAPETGLHDRPVLVLDPGMHTEQIRRADVDAAGRMVATGSFDKTVRVWNGEDGSLIRTIRVPQGPNKNGRIDAVAISPDGSIVAAGGWTVSEQAWRIFFFNAETGNIDDTIEGLPNAVLHLAFSPEGNRLAATIGHGLRVFERELTRCELSWIEVLRDEKVGDASYGAVFAPDGRLATTNQDGFLRVYHIDSHAAGVAHSGGARPIGLAFNPDGTRVAVGFDESTDVRVFDGQTLRQLFSADTSGLSNGNLSKVAWSADGTTLYAGGLYIDEMGHRPVIAWDDAGEGPRRTLQAGTNTIMNLKSLPDGDLLVASGDPWLGRLRPSGTPRWVNPPQTMDPRGKHSSLGVSAGGQVVDFGYQPGGAIHARFDVANLTLTASRGDDLTAPPEQESLPVSDWIENRTPRLDGEPLPLDRFEQSHSLAVHPDGHCFVLGTEWFLRAFDARGIERWRREMLGVAWAVNISGDGRLVVAAYGDGTIRWHSMEDGAELLALFPLTDGENWVVWTPEGVYAATAGARAILRWHVNRGWDRAGEAIPVSDIPETNRPEVIRHVLPKMGTAGALVEVEFDKIRGAVRRSTRDDINPRARLHVLTIGASKYGEPASGLDLEFAHQDAIDFAAALEVSQQPPYAEVTVRTIVDEAATPVAIIDALVELRKNMQQGSGDDLGVVLFCGHGDVDEDDTIYLIPHGGDTSSHGAIKSTCLSAGVLQDEVAEIAKNGRVLLFLDACHSGGVLKPLDHSLRAILTSDNVTFFTSSSVGQVSKESAEWENGAFTEALLEALRFADFDRDGLISVSDLADYLDKRVPELTRGMQRPDVKTRYQRRVFAAAPVG